MPQDPRGSKAQPGPTFLWSARWVRHLCRIDVGLPPVSGRPTSARGFFERSKSYVDVEGSAWILRFRRTAGRAPKAASSGLSSEFAPENESIDLKRESTELVRVLLLSGCKESSMNVEIIARRVLAEFEEMPGLMLTRR